MRLICIVCLVFAISNGAAQNGFPVQDIQARAPYVIEMSSKKPVVGMPSAQVVIDPMQCAADGTVYLEGYGLSPGSVRTLYKISGDGAAQGVPRKPAELNVVDVLSFYPGTRELVTLMQATSRDTSSGAKPVDGYYLYVTDKDGGSAKAISLATVNVIPVSAAVLPSGKIFLLGVEQASREPSLLLLDSDGSLLRKIDINQKQYGSSQELREVYGEKRTDMHRVLEAAQFIPFRDEVLLMQPSSELPILDLNDAGIVRSVKVHLPEGYVPDSMITSDFDWILRARTLSATQKLATKGMVIGAERHIFEVSANDGSFVKELKFTNIRSSDVDCATRGDFTALHVDVDDNGLTLGWTLWAGLR